MAEYVSVKCMLNIGVAHNDPTQNYSLALCSVYDYYCIIVVLKLLLLNCNSIYR